LEQRFPPADPDRSHYGVVGVSWDTDQVMPTEISVDRLESEFGDLSWEFIGGRRIELHAPVAWDFAFLILRCGFGGALAPGMSPFFQNTCSESITCAEEAGGRCLRHRVNTRAFVVLFGAPDEPEGEPDIVAVSSFDLEWYTDSWTIDVVVDMDGATALPVFDTELYLFFGQDAELVPWLLDPGRTRRTVDIEGMFGHGALTIAGVSTFARDLSFMRGDTRTVMAQAVAAPPPEGRLRLSASGNTWTTWSMIPAVDSTDPRATTPPPGLAVRLLPLRFGTVLPDIAFGHTALNWRRLSRHDSAPFSRTAESTVAWSWVHAHRPRAAAWELPTIKPPMATARWTPIDVFSGYDYTRNVQFAELMSFTSSVGQMLVGDATDYVGFLAEIGLDAATATRGFGAVREPRTKLDRPSPFLMRIFTALNAGQRVGLSHTLLRPSGR
jgi:hypothetical protein